ncbi:MAG: RNA-binding protein [Candidatus Paracaedibacteraceae bacterium]|nr:RNA-binding protein [Candidatus Paracaedibacteraceae bacterium]
MNNKLYVSNLPYSVNDQTLSQLFGDHGAVISAKVITDKMSGRSKGFGFVEMETEQQANIAMEKLNGQDLNGRRMNVAIARPKEEGSERRSMGGGR